LASIEAKHELVQIALEMWLTEAMIDAHRPTFGIAEDAMDPGQQDMRRHRADDFRFVLDVLQPEIA